MDKKSALALMLSGAKLQHQYFSDDEWITIDKDGKILAEDGCRFKPYEFWSYRTDDYWEEGWELFEDQDTPKIDGTFLNDNTHTFKKQTLHHDSGMRPSVSIVPSVREGKKTHRNDTCPCGSTKKFKNCCI